MRISKDKLWLHNDALTLCYEAHIVLVTNPISHYCDHFLDSSVQIKKTGTTKTSSSNVPPTGGNYNLDTEADDNAMKTDHEDEKFRKHDNAEKRFFSTNS